MARATLGDLLGLLRCAGCGAVGATLCERCSQALPRSGACPPIPGLDRVVAAWDYTGAARSLILALKLQGRRDAADPLVEGLCRAVAEQGLAGRTLAWVPGKRADIRWRGFDHAALLAQGVARRLGLSAAPVVVRVANPTDQTLLDARERASNVAGAFAAHRCGGGLVLVDDLVTTGATARACADALRRAGATSVELLVCCRA